MKLRSTTNPRSRSQGNVLLLTVFTVIGIGIVLFSCLNLVHNQNVCIARSQAWNACIPLVEAGIEEAMAHLNNPADANPLSDGWVLSGGTYNQQRKLGDCCYAVSITLTNLLQPVIVSTGYVPIPLVGVGAAAAPGFPSAAELQSQYLARSVRVTASKTLQFVKGMVVKESVVLNGNTITTDSFDSTDRNYSTPDGHYNPNRIKDNGDVSTTSGLSDILSIGNANIKGRLNTGPGGTSTIGPMGKVGSLAWHAGSGTGIEPGWSFHDMNISFPDVQRPFSSAPAPVVRTTGPYTYVLTNGNYEMASLNMSTGARMAVTGNAVLLVDGNVAISGNASIDIILPGTLKLYVAGANANIGGVGINNSGWSTNFIYYGLPTNKGLVLKSNGEFTGSIYAPNALLTMVGGGSGIQNFVGACIMRAVSVNGHYNFHYDEALSKFGPPAIYIIKSWVEL